jgi:MFS family permease
LHWSVIFWLNIPLGVVALWITTTVLRRLPRHERPHRLDVLGAILIVTASVAFMLALNLGGRSSPWLSAPIMLLFAAALVVGAGFVWRLLTAPEPLIPVAILLDPIVRWSVLASALGWAAIGGLNIFLPMYLQSVLGFSATDAGLSLMVLMMSLNTSAGLAGQVLGRVQHYKILPICMMVIALAATTMLAVWSDHMTFVWFETLLFLIGVGFGPLPSLCQVSMQNRIVQHQLGIAIGTMSFARNLCTTMMVALLGAIVLTVTSAIAPGTGGPEAALVFGRAFFVILACLATAFVALVLIEERPLRTGIAEEPKA